ncbi:MAG: hypothetical protein R3F14_33280 [Polyangiaceae bacterium]
MSGPLPHPSPSTSNVMLHSTARFSASGFDHHAPMAPGPPRARENEQNSSHIPT